MRILFMGTPDFAKESLESLYNTNNEIIGVVTNPDKPKGRGMNMIYSPVKEFALEKNIPIYQPEKIKKNIQFIDEIRNLNPDIICVVAYGKILPKIVLDIPKLGCINLHGSILPKYRGAAPIQWAILNGDKTTGVTTIYMDEKMDSGDIILIKEIDIQDNQTTGELWEKLSNIGAKLLVETIEQIKNKTAKRQPQGGEYTIAPMLTKEMAKIDWNIMDSEKIKNLVRGLNPIMGAYTMYKNKKIKLWEVEIKEADEKYIGKEPGTILIADDRQGLYIKTIDGIISVVQIQGENAKRMHICDFLRGNKIEVNTILK